MMWQARAKRAPVPASVIAFVVLAIALTAVGCRDYARKTPATDPGEGTTIADSVYRAIEPRIGEQATAPNSDTDPGRDYLIDRFLNACRSNPAWKPRLLLDARERGGPEFYDSNMFEDGSILTFIERSVASTSAAQPDEDAGMTLEAVELMRP